MFAYQERRDTVIALIKLMKNITLSNTDKEQIYNIVMMFRNTPKQKDRFVRAFGLRPPNFTKETIKEIALSYNCSDSSIRSSLLSVEFILYRIPEQYFLVLKEIYEKYNN